MDQAKGSSLDQSISGRTFNHRFRVDQPIGEGKSIVYIGRDLETNRTVAIKLEPAESGRDSIEPVIYGELAGGIGIPRCIWSGNEDNFNVLVTDLLGPSLLTLFQYCDHKFSLKTVLLLVEQLLSRIEYVHSKRLVHCDIKPGNFLMGLGWLGDLVHLVDFDLTERFTEDPFFKDTAAGTVQWASVNALKGWDLWQKDDLESLGYMLVYFMRGSLPWQDIQEVKVVRKWKSELDIQNFCKGLPVEFQEYMTYVKELEFGDEPSYNYLRGLFEKLFKEKQFEHDNIYDWKWQERWKSSNEDKTTRSLQDEQPDAQRVSVQEEKPRLTSPAPHELTPREGWKPNGTPTQSQREAILEFVKGGDANARYFGNQLLEDHGVTTSTTTQRERRRNVRRCVGGSASTIIRARTRQNCGHLDKFYELNRRSQSVEITRPRTGIPSSPSRITKQGRKRRVGCTKKGEGKRNTRKAP